MYDTVALLGRWDQDIHSHAGVAINQGHPIWTRSGRIPHIRTDPPNRNPNLQELLYAAMILVVIWRGLQSKMLQPSLPHRPPPTWPSKLQVDRSPEDFLWARNMGFTDL